MDGRAVIAGYPKARCVFLLGFQLAPGLRASLNIDSKLTPFIRSADSDSRWRLSWYLLCARMRPWKLHMSRYVAYARNAARVQPGATIRIAG